MAAKTVTAMDGTRPTCYDQESALIFPNAAGGPQRLAFPERVGHEAGHATVSAACGSISSSSGSVGSPGRIRATNSCGNQQRKLARRRPVGLGRQRGSRFSTRHNSAGCESRRPASIANRRRPATLPTASDGFAKTIYDILRVTNCHAANFTHKQVSIESKTGTNTWEATTPANFEKA